MSGLQSWMSKSRSSPSSFRKSLCSQWLIFFIEIFLVIGIWHANSLAADTSGDVHPTNYFAFNISPQPLASALNAFAEVTGWQVSFPADLAKGKTSSEVIGSYSPEAALQVILAGTGLTYQLTDPRTFTLIQEDKIQESPSSTLLPNNAPSLFSVENSTETVQPKPIKVPEIVVKDVRTRDDGSNYVAEEASTATRTDTPLIQVPQSIEVVTRKVLEDQRAIRVEQALRNVSGMALGESTGSGIGSDQAFCRGFTCGYFKNYLRNESTNQVSTYRDIANMERIEVLKGPPSVLYGRSEPGGIVSILTKQPLSQHYASANMIFGSYDFYRPMVDMSGPLTSDKTVLYRLNFAYENSGSFRDMVQSQRYFVAPVFSWDIGSNTSLTVEGEYIRDNRTPDFAYPPSEPGWRPCPTVDFWGNDLIR